MGKLFLMSTRFNKCSASDFGLVALADNKTLDSKDGSIWEKAKLYDFGWGEENGFYRVPLPTFDTLFDIVLHSNDQEDRYGAAAIILKRSPEELLSRCETIIGDPTKKKESKILVDVFGLDRPINRSPITGKTYQQISDDYNRWGRIARIAARFKNYASKTIRDH